MLLLIPLGGIGKRFSELGYNKPKPLINVFGKPIIFWLLDSLDLSIINTIIIPYNSNLIKFNFESLLKKHYPHINFIFIQLLQNTLGAAHTIHIALQNITLPDQPILCLDGDNFYNINIIKLWNKNNQIILFHDDNTQKQPIYSYAQIDNNIITNIKEKEFISNYACSGGYAFNSWFQLKNYASIVYNDNITQKGELYTSSIISLMIKHTQFTPLVINQDDFVCLGTPLQLRLFCNNYPKIKATNLQLNIQPKRFCFDLDNTLVSFPTIHNDYTTVLPIHKNIQFLKYLKSFGHTIIIYTARRMKTHNSNIGASIKDIGKITFDTLDKFDIPYDEIYFGKPHAHFYIDDLAISSFDDLEKELGFYSSYIKPRSFNSVQNTTINIYRKKSNDLSGEIYYYNNISNNVKDLFPIMFQYDDNNKWYDMEKINGIPISKLFLSQELTIELFEIVISSIERLHQNIPSTPINIYLNYSQKLTHRYNNFDYSSFPNNSNIYQSLLLFFNKYQEDNLGKIAMIHGDPVFTNILINQFGKIKLIDMRGKVGDTLSIYGDIYYDYAKIYQSIIGYEEVLDNKTIDINYKNNIINYFHNRMKNHIHIIKMITKLLIFTLIPLHDKDKQHSFYSLIDNI